MEPLTKEQIDARVMECLKQGNKLFKAKAFINEIRIAPRMLKKNGRAGYTDSGAHFFVEFSGPLLKKHPDFFIKEIIPHEVAHVIAAWLYLQDDPRGETGHGKNWQAIASALGCTPSALVDPLHASLHRYKTTTGKIKYMTKADHDYMQTTFKTMRDIDDPEGGRITAAGYLPDE